MSGFDCSDTTAKLSPRIYGEEGIRLIGISGRAFSGKDTVAAMLRTLLDDASALRAPPTTDASALRAPPTTDASALRAPPTTDASARQWQLRSFAGALKRSAEHLLGLREGVADDREERKQVVPAADCTLARFLQLYGQALRTGVHPDFWIRTLFSRYRPGDRWIITDVRHPSEAQAIRDRGGVIIKIEASFERASGETAVIRQDGRDARHISETAVDEIVGDYTIHNDAGLPELEASVRALWSMLR